MTLKALKCSEGAELYGVLVSKLSVHCLSVKSGPIWLIREQSPFFDRSLVL